MFEIIIGGSGSGKSTLFCKQLHDIIEKQRQSGSKYINIIFTNYK